MQTEVLKPVLVTAKETLLIISSCPAPLQSSQKIASLTLGREEIVTHCIY